jgi:hypothetical protein
MCCDNILNPVSILFNYDPSKYRLFSKYDYSKELKNK